MCIYVNMCVYLSVWGGKFLLGGINTQRVHISGAKLSRINLQVFGRKVVVYCITKFHIDEVDV